VPEYFEPIDFHIHTLRSPCASRRGPEAGLPAYVPRVRELGWKQLCISDHVVEDPTLPWVGPFYECQDRRMIDSARQEAEALAPDLDIYVGAEADMFDVDKFCASAEWSAELDFLIMPPNHFHLEPHVQPPSTEPDDVAAFVWAHMEAVAAQPWIDIMAHPFLTFLKDWPPLDQIVPRITDAQRQELFDTMVRNRQALEINTCCSNNPLWREVARPFYQMAVDRGVLLTYGSDAHSVDRLGMFRELAWPFVESLDVTPEQFATPETFLAKRGRSGSKRSPSP